VFADVDVRLSAIDMAFARARASGIATVEFQGVANTEAGVSAVVFEGDRFEPPVLFLIGYLDRCVAIEDVIAPVELRFVGDVDPRYSQAIEVGS
jgi:hypothetical protein